MDPLDQDGCQKQNRTGDNVGGKSHDLDCCLEDDCAFGRGVVGLNGDKKKGGNGSMSTDFCCKHVRSNANVRCEPAASCGK